MCRTSWRQIVVPEMLGQHWKLANYMANLPDNRWLNCALVWTTGRTWDGQKLENERTPSFGANIHGSHPSVRWYAPPGFTPVATAK